MRRHKWQTNGESIKFNINGGLDDGHHRLLGCVEADTPFETYVVYDLPSEARATLDTGKNRRGWDAIQIMLPEFKASAKWIDNAVSLLWRYSEQILASRTSDARNTFRAYPSPQHRVSLISKIPELAECTNAALSIVGKDYYKTVRPGVAIAVLFLGTLANCRARAEFFLQKAIAGDNLPPYSPVLAYRQFILNLGNRGIVASSDLCFSASIQAINAIQEDRQMKHLKPVKIPIFGGAEPSVVYDKFELALKEEEENLFAAAT